MATKITTLNPSRDGSGNGSGRHGGGDNRDPFKKSPGPEAVRMGMGFALAAIIMLFVALTSAYVVRHGLDARWQRIQMPGLLLFNTAVLLASSIGMEKARRSGEPRNWLTATLFLGLLFLAGQLAAWWQLSLKGIYLSTNPHSSFFYLLTGLHGLHLMGGVLALGCLVRQPWRSVRWLGSTALYWHFMDGLWVYLLVLLFAWR